MEDTESEEKHFGEHAEYFNNDRTISERIEAGERICEACMHHDGGYICKLLGHRGKPMKTCGWWNKPVAPPPRKKTDSQEKIDRAIDRISEAHSLAFVNGEWVILRDKKRIKEIISQLISKEQS